jgi:hypothetical protein
VLWTDLRILIVDTGRAWWRLLPLIIGVYLLGWLGSELTLRVAVIGTRHSVGIGGANRLRSAPVEDRPLTKLRVQGAVDSTPHGTLRSGGCVGGFAGWPVWPQIGHADPVRRTFVCVELRRNSPCTMTAR